MDRSNEDPTSDNKEQTTENKTGKPKLKVKTEREAGIEEYVSQMNFPVFDYKELLEQPSYLCASVLIASCRRSGKTVIMKDIMSNIHKYYDDCYLFSGSLDAQRKEYDFVDDRNCFDHFDESKLQEIYERQKKHVLQLEAVGKDKYKEGHKCMVILDDFIGDPQVQKSKVFKDFFTFGRHYLISIWCLSQTVVGIPKTMRRNCDIVIVFFLEDYRDREAISEQFLSIGDSRTMMGDRIQRRITSVPYQAVIIKCFKKTQEYEKLVSTYIANPKPKKFKFKTEDSWNKPFKDQRRTIKRMNNF